MWALIIALLALAVGSFALYEIITFEEDSLVCDTNNLEIYDDLEKRIETLEYGIKANNKNVEILAENITKLEIDVINLRNDVKTLSNEMQNTSTSLNNIIPFVDTTRGMVEDNKRRLDNIQGKVE